MLMCLFLPISLRIQLVVEFVDGVTRLELMKKADELKVVYGCEACETWFNSATCICAGAVVPSPSSHPNTLTPSYPHPHTLTPSHLHTLTSSHLTLIPSHPHTLIPSSSPHSHTLTSSHPHILTLSHPHALTSSHPHTSYPHTLILISSHPQILTECITVALQKNTRGWSTLQIWVGTLSRDYSSSCHVILTPSHPHTLTHIQFEMRAKQTRLRVLTRTENQHLSDTITLPTPHSLTPARTLPPWGETFPSDNPGPHPFPFNR